MLAADGEGGAEVYSLATTRDQARIVFGDAQTMARRSQGFRTRFSVNVGAHNMNVLQTGSKFEALSAEGSTLDGLNIHFGCIDELHAHKTRTVYDVVETGTGKRDNSLLWVITTAGSNRSGICYEVRTFVTRLLDGVFEDDSQFGIVYGLDDGDDWTSEDSLMKANPNWGISVRPEILGPLQAKAMQLPSAMNNFKTKHLNEWVNADTAWMDMRSWDAWADLNDLSSRFAVQAVAFDPFQATQLSTRMMSEGLPMIEVRPTVLNFSEPMKTLEALVLQKKLVHDGDPVLGWMVSNVVAHLDAKDNIYPRKERAENKIDGIVALIMALSRAIKPGDSVVLGSDYELVLL
jgi:phage terminase large subunit-like protein